MNELRTPDFKAADIKNRAGIFLLDKEAGISSAQAIAKVKHKLGLVKIGHAGTLDPFATGLLVCLVGNATRCARFAEEGRKVYSGVMQFGITTSSDDITGEVLSRSEEFPEPAALIAALPQFIGDIMQIPPQISALKIQGKRSYALAREGVKVEHVARPVTVFRFEATPIARDQFSFVVECSAGTYIRALARDLGEMFGCGGVLNALRRESSFPFSVNNARTIDQISASDMRSWQELFPSMTQLALPGNEARRLQAGDQAMLRALSQVPEYQKHLQGVTRALYLNADDQQVYGILEQQDSRWVVGLNFAN